MQGTVSPPESVVRIAHVIYGLYAASFFVGLTAIVAIVLDYIYRGDAEGTWLASHFRWQIRTFWFSALWGGLLLVAMVVGIFMFFFTAAAPFGLGAGPEAIATRLLGAMLAAPFTVVAFLVAVLVLSIWVTYRIIRGWAALASRQPLPV
ncbi:MAG: hypothetical protein N2544_14335 [Burkholderiales bacterium]|nr:hypothetical protein [Burkholderiales bacterium]